jgi:hypothetical protein
MFRETVTFMHGSSILVQAKRLSNSRVYRIPDKEDRFDLKVSPPYGEDHIVVYASEVPLGEVATEPIGQGLRLYRGGEKEFALKSRGIQVVGADAGGSGGREFYEASWTVTTTK